MKRMNKLLLLCLILLALAGTAAVVTNMEFEESVEESQTVTVFSFEDSTLTGLSWSYNGEIIGFTKGEDGWSYPEDEHFPANDTLLDAIAAAVQEITSAKTIENVTDLAQYGLDEPVRTVTVTTDVTTTLIFGAETQMGGDIYMSNGDGNVYLVDSTIPGEFGYGLYDLVLEEEIPNMENLTAFLVEAETQILDLQYLEESGIAYSDKYVWFAVTDAGYETMDTQLVNSLTVNLRNLNWDSCADYYADENELATYGLDVPAVTVTVSYLEEVQVETDLTTTEGDPVYETQQEACSFVLEIGGYADSNCYARIQGSDMVYLIDGGVCDDLLYTTTAELQPDEVLQMDWSRVSMVEITLDGETHILTIGTETVTDEEGNTTEETVYTMNGEQVSAITILTALDVMKGTDYATDVEPQRGEEIRIVAHQNHETYPTMELVFYQYDSTVCLARLNGKSTLFVDRENVVALIEKVNTLILG